MISGWAGPGFGHPSAPGPGRRGQGRRKSLEGEDIFPFRVTVPSRRPPLIQQTCFRRQTDAGLGPRRGLSPQGDAGQRARRGPGEQSRGRWGVGGEAGAPSRPRGDGAAAGRVTAEQGGASTAVETGLTRRWTDGQRGGGGRLGNAQAGGAPRGRGGCRAGAPRSSCSCFSGLRTFKIKRWAGPDFEPPLPCGVQTPRP